MTTSTTLDADELVALIKRVFVPRESEHAVGIMVDLPDAKVPDDAAWATRRAIAAGWVSALRAAEPTTKHGWDVALIAYRNAHTNNGDLPPRVWVFRDNAAALLPKTAEDGAGEGGDGSTDMAQIFESFPMLIAVTKFSSTAPLKMAARQTARFRAATMPGFGPAMVPALRLDYGEVNRRVSVLKALLDRATGADCVFRVGNETECRLHLDLRHRTGHASGGLLPELGIAGNVPSGEAYIVPYEGEVAGDPSRSEGVLPVQFGEEVVRYRIEGNKAVEVLSTGPASEREADLIRREPAYANLAELGLGVLAAFGIKPIGEILLDEKLGLHIAFGRSEHFGGQVGPKQFSSPEAVIHIDRVFVPEMQPAVTVVSVDLHMEDAGSTVALMRNGDYAIAF